MQLELPLRSLRLDRPTWISAITTSPQDAGLPSKCSMMNLVALAVVSSFRPGGGRPGSWIWLFPTPHTRLMPPNRAIEKLDSFNATRIQNGFGWAHPLWSTRSRIGTLTPPIAGWSRTAEEALELTRGLQSRKVAQDCDATWTACSIHMLNRNGAGWGGSGRSRPLPPIQKHSI